MPFLFLFVLTPLHCAGGADKMENSLQKNFIIADIGPLPSDSDPTSIGSVSKYLFLSHLVRNPISIDKTASIFGDLAESWTISSDKKTYKLKFRDGQFFNDGTPITAKNFAETIMFRKAAKGQIHFDFGLIEKVEVHSPYVTIELKKPLPLFISNLTQPEFGVLHPKTILAPSKGPLQCSGYYCLKSFTREKIEMEKNPYTKSTGPDVLIFQDNGASKYEKITSEKIQFILEFGEVPAKYREGDVAKKFELVRPHIGFTHWVSLNPKRPELTDVEVRRQILTNVRIEFQKKELNAAGFEFADQLFLPGGPGRLSTEEVTALWKKISGSKSASPARKEKRELQILITDKFRFPTQLKEAFTAGVAPLGFTTNFIEYHNQTELQNHINDGAYDGLLINNDFSGFDLTMSVAVTFNPQRPLVMVPSGHAIKEHLDNLSQEPILEKRTQSIKEISSEVLDAGLALPLLYQRATFLKSKSLNISGWSMLYPEVAFWKAEFP